MLKKIGIVAILMFSLSLFLLPFVSAQGQADSRLVILVINNTDLKSIQQANMPNLKSLIKKGKLAVGIMNVRPAKATITEASSYLTVGAGNKANASVTGSLAFNSGVEFNYQNKAYQSSGWYRQSTGYSLRPGELVNLGMIDASRLSGKYDYPLTPGLLGSLLKKAGIKRAVVGNADSIDGYHREATLIAMDKGGRVDTGALEGSFSDTRLLVETKKHLKKARFLVIEHGQTARIEYNRRFLSDKQYGQLRNKALGKADKFLGLLTREMDLSKDMLMIVSPSPSTLAQKKRDWLAPIMISNPNQKTIVYSESTKWPGLVNNLDIVPTVLKFFNISKPAEITGNNISTRDLGSRDSFGYLLSEERVAVANNLARSPLLTGFAVLIISGIVLAVLLLFLTNLRDSHYRLVQALLVLIVSIPFVLLLFGSFSYASPVVPIVGVPLVSIALTAGLLLVLRDFFRIFLFLFSATFVVIVFDLFTGFNLMKTSVLGYSPIIGARFYGLGNEYEGIIISTAILPLCMLKDSLGLDRKSFNYLIAAFFVLIVFIIGFPALGADVGGALAASIGFVFAIIYLNGSRFGWKQFFAIVAIPTLVLAAVFLSDKFLGTQTHAAKAGSIVAQGGPAAALTIFKRKILANFKLIKYTAWTNVLITILVGMPILFMKPAGAVKRLKEKFPNVWAGSIGVSFGSIAAFLFNDSGVVAAATCLLYAAVVVLYAILEEQRLEARG